MASVADYIPMKTDFTLGKIPENETESETLIALGEEIREIAEKNQDKLDIIHGRLNDKVISGYTYAVDGKLEKAPDSIISISATPVRNLVASCLEAYEYKGEPLEEVYDVFNDKVDWTMKTTSDILRLNKELCALGSKYADCLSDRMRARATVKKVIGNLVLVSKAIDELIVISQDVPDTATSKIEDNAKELSACFHSISSKLSNFNMELNVTQYLGYEGTLEDIVKFDDPQAMSKAATLEAHAAEIADIVYYEINDKSCMASASRDCTITLWDLSDNSVISTLEGHAGAVNAMAKFDLDGKPCLASGSFDHSVKLWDLTTNSLITTLAGHTHYVYSLASFTLDDLDVPYLASGGCDKCIKIWNLAEESIVASVPTDADYTFAVAMWKEGDKVHLATGGSGGDITIWEISEDGSPKAIKTLSGHSDDVRALVTYKMNDVVYLASASLDGTIKLWDISDGSVVATLTDHEGCTDITLAVFVNGDDGAPALASGDETGTIKLWNLPKAALVKTFDEMTTGCISSLAVFNSSSKPTMAVGAGNSIELWE